MSERTRQYLALALLLVLALTVLANTAVLAVLVVSADSSDEYTTVYTSKQETQERTCGLSKVTLAGYIVYTNACTREVLAYTSD